MQELVLYFDAGTVDGSGRDANGRFVFTGTYDNTGRVRMTKQYANRHQILFEGAPDGTGAIVGECSKGPQARGSFALTPLRSWADPAVSIDDEDE
jgi:hypothetical protein